MIVRRDTALFVAILLILAASSTWFFWPAGRKFERATGEAHSRANQTLVSGPEVVSRIARGADVHSTSSGSSDSPIREVVDVGDDQGLRDLVKEAPSEELLVRGTVGSILDHIYFSGKIDGRRIQDPEFQSRFAAALVQVRAMRSDLIAKRDAQTSSSVRDMLRTGYRPGSKPQEPGELGSIVALAGTGGGWVPASKDSPAYETQKELDWWRFTAVDFMLRVK